VIAKEIRALLPAWLAAVAVLLAASLGLEPLRYLGVPLYFIAVAALGALSVGHEYAYGTLGLALALPVPRRRIWATKLAVLLPMLAALALLATWRVDLGRVDPTFGAALFWLPALAALFVPSWITMVTHSPLAGTVLTISLVGGSIGLAEWTGIYLYGYTSDVDVFRAAFMRWTILLLSLAAAIAGWRTFARLEVTGERADDVQLLGDGRAVAPAGGVRPRHPIAALVFKELRLQQLAIVIAGIYTAGCLFAMLAGQSAPGAFAIAIVLTVCYKFVMPAVVGSLACAEEHQFGTHDAQLLQPLKSSQQWLVKSAVALGVTIVTTLALPWFMTRTFPVDAVAGFGPISLRPNTIIMAIAGTSVCLYVSTLARTVVSALLASLAAIVGLIAFVLTVTVGVWVTVYDSVHRMVASHPVHRMPESHAVWIIALALFTWLLWQTGLANYRYADRSAARVTGHAVVVGAALVIGLAAAAAVMAVMK
jgi:hypothetical protein